MQLFKYMYINDMRLFKYMYINDTQLFKYMYIDDMQLFKYMYIDDMQLFQLIADTLLKQITITYYCVRSTFTLSTEINKQRRVKVQHNRI